MREVTLSAPSYNELKKIYLARDIYLPRKLKQQLSPEQLNDNYKKFFQGYNSFRDKPELKELLEEIGLYEKQLKTFSINDEDVADLRLNFAGILGNFIYALAKSVFYLSFVRLIT